VDWSLAVVVMLMMSSVIGWVTQRMFSVRGWNTRRVSLGVDQKMPSSGEMGVGYGMLKPAIGAGSVVLVSVWSQEPCRSPVGSSLFVSLC